VGNTGIKRVLASVNCFAAIRTARTAVFITYPTERAKRSVRQCLDNSVTQSILPMQPADGTSRVSESVT
jgi:hypothetical protein